mmetsp:Transcript_23855/g.66649  ORF Transcript_23855/g.66649 Transcript_23855/m.66649 type:complete len:254 (-) Transcript_23855:980-1741(-)
MTEFVGHRDWIQSHERRVALLIGESGSHESSDQGDGERNGTQDLETHGQESIDQQDLGVECGLSWQRNGERLDDGAGLIDHLGKLGCETTGDGGNEECLDEHEGGELDEERCLDDGSADWPLKHTKTFQDHLENETGDHDEERRHLLEGRFQPRVIDEESVDRRHLSTQSIDRTQGVDGNHRNGPEQTERSRETETEELTKLQLLVRLAHVLPEDVIRIRCLQNLHLEWLRVLDHLQGRLCGLERLEGHEGRR